MEIFKYAFMERAFIAGAFLAISAGLIGVIMVLRRESMIGHGLSHATFGGVALGLLLSQPPVAFALLVAMIGALVMISLEEGSGLGGDTGIGIISSLGMAIGIVIATMAGDFNANLLSYLFGSILTIQKSEVYIAIGLSIGTIATFSYFYRELIYITLDKECAKVSGINVKAFDIMLSMFTAITVVVGMRIVGLLLITALMVIPAASGLIISNSIRSSMLTSCALGVLSVILGLIISFYLNWPASGAIVIIQGLVLGAALILTGS